MITFSNPLSIESLRRAVEISLLTWGLAKPDDKTDGDKHGWWGDSFPPKSGALIGSRLWLLKRSKLITDQTVLQAEEIVREALQWMIDDQIVERIDLDLRVEGYSQIVGDLTLILASGETLLIPFKDIWTINYAV